jgi:hypothetical protein
MINNYYIIIIIIFIIINSEKIYIYIKDLIFFIKILFFYKFQYNNNFIENYLDKNFNDIKILITSFDNRINLKYLKYHNNNIEKYCRKWKNVNYFFTNECDTNMYWCKLYLIREKLQTNNYDYVMWMDTDAVIINDKISLQKLVNSYSSDIFISNDTYYKIHKTNILCAGVFIIKNSDIGKKFIDECIYTWENSKCFKNEKIQGIYAQLCYEQGTMNYLIYEKYIKYTTILEPKIFRNSFICNKNSFILHNYGVSEKQIEKCFNSIDEIN